MMDIENNLLHENGNINSDSLLDTPTYLTPDDPALITAWTRCLAYTEESARQRVLNRRIRLALVVFTWVASVLAVLIVLPYIASINPLREILRISLIMLPILLAALMTFAIEFTPTVTWIIYSALSNLIDQEIFRYRMKVGDYSEEFSILERQQSLIKHTEREALIEVVPPIEVETPYWQLMNSEETSAKQLINKLKSIWLYWTDDDGFSSLTATEYIEKRILSKRNWYVSKSKKLFQEEKTFRILILTVAGLGSIAAGISASLAWIVVVTTATVTAITARWQLNRTIEDTTSYFDTIRRFDKRLALWKVLPKAERDSVENTRLLAHDMENILSDDTLMWQRQALRMQSVAEHSLIQNVQELIQDDRKLEHSSGDNTSDEEAPVNNQQPVKVD